jgi:hypothetical protein
LNRNITPLLMSLDTVDAEGVYVGVASHVEAMVIDGDLTDFAGSTEHMRDETCSLGVSP